jgi:hypothetical protein
MAEVEIGQCTQGGDIHLGQAPMFREQPVVVQVIQVFAVVKRGCLFIPAGRRFLR